MMSDIIKLTKDESGKDESGLNVLAAHRGGLQTITAEKLAVISEKMVEVDRANNTAGKMNTQTTSQLMTLTMLNDSPYRRLRQCLAEIEKTRGTLGDTYYANKMALIQIQRWREMGDDMSLVRIEKKEYEMGRRKMYIDGALKEIATFQCAYDEIREANGIPENWDERDAEEDEIAHHIKMAFRNCIRDLIQNNAMNMGTMEYLEQYGIHPQTARKVVQDYIEEEEKMIAEGNFPTVNRLYDFLDTMVETFKNAHKDVMNRIGIKEIIRNDYLYLEKEKEKK